MGSFQGTKNTFEIKKTSEKSPDVWLLSRKLIFSPLKIKGWKMIHFLLGQTPIFKSDMLVPGVYLLYIGIHRGLYNLVIQGLSL